LIGGDPIISHVASSLDPLTPKTATESRRKRADSEDWIIGYKQHDERTAVPREPTGRKDGPIQ